MKLIWWILIGLGVLIFPLGIVLLIKFLVDTSWLPVIVVLIIEVILVLLGAIIGLIVFIAKHRNKAAQSQNQAMTIQAIQRAVVRERQYDRDYAENFDVRNRILMRVGEAGSQPTTILWLTGRGTEHGKRMDALVILDDPDKVPFWRIGEPDGDKGDERIMAFAQKMALHPASEIKEERIPGRDEFGNPITTVRIRRMTATQKRDEEAKEKATEANAI